MALGDPGGRYPVNFGSVASFRVAAVAFGAVDERRHHGGGKVAPVEDEAGDGQRRVDAAKRESTGGGR